MRIVIANPTLISINASIANRPFPLLIAKSRLTIGSMNGRVNIAPITFARLFSISPTMAMIVEMVRRTKIFSSDSNALISSLPL